MPFPELVQIPQGGKLSSGAFSHGTNITFFGGVKCTKDLKCLVFSVCCLWCVWYCGLRGMYGMCYMYGVYC